MGMCVLYGSYMGVAPSPLLICYVFFSIGSSSFFDSYQIFIIKKIPPLLIYPYIDTPLLSHPHIQVSSTIPLYPGTPVVTSWKIWVRGGGVLRMAGGHLLFIIYYSMISTIILPNNQMPPQANKIANNKITQQLSTTIILATTIKANNNKINNSIIQGQ